MKNLDLENPVTLGILCNRTNPPKPVGIHIMDSKGQFVAGATLDELKRCAADLDDIERKRDQQPTIAELKAKTLEALQREVENEDNEIAHIAADRILAEFVEMLGFKEIADAYDEVGKWYS